ncbi:cell wall-binding repeat-containing protein [Euzebya pacifica]|nr:cell wall-binding repeat-containing protein [Euzebya pacifica]
MVLRFSGGFWSRLVATTAVGLVVASLLPSAAWAQADHESLIYVELALPPDGGRPLSYTVHDLLDGSEQTFTFDHDLGRSMELGNPSPDGRVMVLRRNVPAQTLDEPPVQYDVTLLDTVTGTELRTYESVPVNSTLAWLDDGTLLVSDSTHTRLLDLASGELTTILDEHVGSAIVSPTGSHFWDGRNIRDRSGQVVRAVRPQDALATPAAWSPDGTSIVTHPDPNSGDSSVLRVAPDSQDQTLGSVGLLPAVHPDGDHVYFTFQRAESQWVSQRVSLTNCCAIDPVLPDAVSTTPWQFATLASYGLIARGTPTGCDACRQLWDLETGQILFDGPSDARDGFFVQEGSNDTDPAGSTRLAGASRVETAVALSMDQWPAGGAQSVVLATSDNFADAQTASPLAIAEGGPILLSQADDLHPASLSEIRRILPLGNTVYLVGGTAVLTDDLQSQVDELGYETVRIAGRTRGETSTAIAAHLGGSHAEIFAIDGGDFVPGVIAGSIAAQRTGAVVVSGPEGAIYARDHTDAFVVQVGESAFDAAPDEVVTADSPTDLSLAMAERYLPSANRAAVASADNFPDALAGAAHAAREGIPVLLTPSNNVPGTLAARLQDLSAFFVYGGQSAVSSSALAAALG